jgi:hypothetical protein
LRYAQHFSGSVALDAPSWRRERFNHKRSLRRVAAMPKPARCARSTDPPKVKKGSFPAKPRCAGEGCRRDDRSTFIMVDQGEDDPPLDPTVTWSAWRTGGSPGPSGSRGPLRGVAGIGFEVYELTLVLVSVTYVGIDNAGGDMPTNKSTDIGSDRRKFLRDTGKFAAATPPVVTFLLSTTLSTEAVARSGLGGPPSWVSPGPPSRARPKRRR